MTKRQQSSREKALRRYFRRSASRASWMLGLGILLLVGGFVLADATEGASLLPGAALVILWILVLFFRLLSGGFSVPGDAKVDRWLDEGINKLVSQSLGKLGLDSGERMSEPLVISGPILWSTYGIDDDDIVWKEGKDGLARFGVYRVTVVQLTDRHLGAYACDYDFLRDVALNEETDEYHYQDIVSVSTKEMASSYTLPTGKKLTTIQMFRISVSSGEAIEVVVGSNILDEILGEFQMPGTETEKAVATIRAMLREKKGV